MSDEICMILNQENTFNLYTERLKEDVLPQITAAYKPFIIKVMNVLEDENCLFKLKRKEYYSVKFEMVIEGESVECEITVTFDIFNPVSVSLWVWVKENAIIYLPMRLVVEDDGRIVFRSWMYDNSAQSRGNFQIDFCCESKEKTIKEIEY